MYSRRSHLKAPQILSLHVFMRTKQIELLLEKKRKKKTYRQRMIESFEKDPFERFTLMVVLNYIPINQVSVVLFTTNKMENRIEFVKTL